MINADSDYVTFVCKLQVHQRVCVVEPLQFAALFLRLRDVRLIAAVGVFTARIVLMFTTLLLYVITSAYDACPSATLAFGAFCAILRRRRRRSGNSDVIASLRRHCCYGVVSVPDTFCA